MAMKVRPVRKSRRRRCDVTLNRRATSMIRTPIFGCTSSTYPRTGSDQARSKEQGRSDATVARTDRPSGPRTRGSRLGDRGSWLRSVLIGLLLVTANHASAASGTTAPPLEESLGAWFEVRSWLDAGELPAPESPEARISIPGSDRVLVVLRVDGRTIGVGGSDEAGPFALRTATEKAIRNAYADRILLPLSRTERRRALSRLQLEVEIAGTRRPLVGATLAAAASRIRPGIDGVAVRRRQEVAMAFPGRLLSTGAADSQSITLVRLLRELGLPPKDLPELRRIDSVQLETFETIRIGQDASDAPPRERRRGGIFVPRAAIDVDLLTSMRDRIDDRLGRWRPPAPEETAALDVRRMWLGDYSPVSDRYRPLEARPTEEMIAVWATADAPGTVIPGPDDIEELSAELVDLGILAASRANDAGRLRSWLALVPDRPAEADAVSASRRAAALMLADPDTVDEATVDAAYAAAWERIDDASEIVAAFDWLALAELGRTRRGLPNSGRIESLRAVQDVLLLRQFENDGDTDGGFPLRAGIGATPDARSVRVLLGMAALASIPDDDDARAARTEDGLRGAVRFVGQLMLDPSEASDLKGGRTGLGGVQRSPSDPEQSLAATATTRLALTILLASRGDQSPSGP